MTPANSRWPRTSTSMSSLAMTDADLGPRSSRASSPKYCPGPSLAISRFPRFTEALPSRMRKNSWPGLPSCTRTLPAGTSTSSDARAMVCSSFFEQAEKSGTLPRCSRYWSFFRSGMGRMITTPRRLVLMGVDLSTLVQRADTRIVLVVMDGLGGYATVDRGSELEEASTPNLDRLVTEGAAGLVEPVGPGITPGSGPGHLGLFGYDPLTYELGRGALSAAGLDAKRTAEVVAELDAQVRKLLVDEPKANTLLLRGFDSHRELPSMQQRFGLTPAAVAIYPMYRGIARLVGMEVLPKAADLDGQVD